MDRSFTYLRSLFFLLVMLLAAAPALAHELRPAYLELREDEPGEFSVLWKTPMRGELRLALSPEFSGRTETLTEVLTYRANNAAVQTWRMKAVEALRGQSLRIVGLDGTMTDALVRMEFADGTTWTQRLTPGQPAAAIPVRQSWVAVAGVYLELGVEHILGGVDHLLFVLALLLVTGRGWKLVKTVTAFTVAHSITLGLAALGVVHVPSAPVEAAIALSIVLVALESAHARGVGRSSRSPPDECPERGVAPAAAGSRGPSLTARSPWIVAFAFGLLHGFGFAGALNEIGLPEGRIAVALLFFNVGVETGQLLFVAVVVGSLALLRRSRLGLPRWSELAAPYAIGSIASFWVIQRIAAF